MTRDDLPASITAMQRLGADLATLPDGGGARATAIASVGAAALSLQQLQGALVPPAVPDQVRYRCQTRHLFQPVAQSHLQPRLPGQQPLYIETSGPDALSVDNAIGWRWATKGGDFGPALATIPANGYPRGSEGGWYRINATDALLLALTKGRAWAFRLGANTSRHMHGRDGANPPRLVITRTDGTTHTVPCWVSCYSGASKPSQTVPEQQMPVFVEFDRPEADPLASDIADAWIEFYVSQHNGMYSRAAFTLHLLEPDVSLPPVRTGGIAADYVNDEGIAAHPSVIYHHDYRDGRDESEFLARPSDDKKQRVLDNFEAARNYSPDCFDPDAPADPTRYPYRNAGKWLGAGPNVSVVPSTHAEFGFEPVRPGVGALRVHLPREARAVEGGMVGNAGTLGSALEMPLPVPRIGRQRTISIRCKARWGLRDGKPHELDLDAIAAVWQIQRADGTLEDPNWLSFGGKCGITATHTNKAGGRSGSSGGGGGYQLRESWGRFPTGRPGPQAHGMGRGTHFFDYFGRRHPLGKSAAGTKLPWGRGRVGGVMYPYTWYDHETIVTLSSVDKPGMLPDGRPHVVNGVQQFWAEDGEMTVLVDGMVVWHDTGLCFRSLPFVGMPASWDPATSSVMYQMAELGARAAELNTFSGGVTPGAEEICWFYTDLVVSDGAYIGPSANA